MTRAYVLNFTIVALAIIAILPTMASAAIPTIVQCTGAPLVAGGQPDCTICDIARTAQNLLNAAIYITVFLSSGLFAWAGLIYVTNIANHGEITRARSIFVNVIIGLVIIMASWLVIDTIMKTLLNNDDSQFGPWNRICGSSSW